MTPSPKVSDELRKLWREAGGSFHGPNVETGTMPEALLLPFLQRLRSTADADARDAGRLTRRALERSAALIARMYNAGPECDCTMDGGSHSCGWPELRAVHDLNTRALSASSAGE